MQDKANECLLCRLMCVYDVPLAVRPGAVLVECSAAWPCTFCSCNTVHILSCGHASLQDVYLMHFLLEFKAGCFTYILVVSVGAAERLVITVL
jgi:hypothetical protein